MVGHSWCGRIEVEKSLVKKIYSKTGLVVIYVGEKGKNEEEKKQGFEIFQAKRSSCSY